MEPSETETTPVEAESVKTDTPQQYMPGKYGGLLRRGNPGNKGGIGRIRRSVRERCANLSDKTAVNYLARVVKDETAKHSDRIMAASKLLNVGIGDAGQLMLSAGQAEICRLAIEALASLTPDESLVHAFALRLQDYLADSE